MDRGPGLSTIKKTHGAGDEPWKRKSLFLSESVRGRWRKLKMR